MKIKWVIKKKRGNWRPVVTYTCEKSDLEMELGISSVNIKTTIPKVWRAYYVDDEEIALSREGHEERDETWDPRRYIQLSTPEPTEKSNTVSFFLPWKPGPNPEYPEVEESFRRLQEEYEKKLKEACNSLPFEKKGEINITVEFKKQNGLQQEVIKPTNRRILIK